MKLNYVLATALFAIGCGGGGVDIKDFGSEISDAFCERAVKCGQILTVADCKALVDFSQLSAQLEKTQQVKKGTYNSDKAEECIAAFAKQTCSSSAEINREAPAACDEFFKGTIAPDGACTHDTQCQSGNCIVTGDAMACAMGTCAGFDAAIGASCTKAACVDGAFCNDGTCAALKAENADCEEDDECGYNLKCIGSPGKCLKPAATGQACMPGGCDNIGERCKDGTCKGLSKEGEACAMGIAGLFDCLTPLFCDQTSFTCTKPKAIGEACGACVDGAFCNDMRVCEAAKANGAMCGSDSECQSDNCVIAQGQEIGTCGGPDPLCE